MNKKTLTAVLAAVLILAGCSNGNKPAETTTAPAATTTTEATTAAPETTAETTTETTSTEAETEPVTEAETDPTDERVIQKPGDDDVIMTLGGLTIYGRDIVMNEYDMAETNSGLVRLSTGTYYDSETNPDWFATDEFTYNGDKVPLGELKELRVGDTVGGLAVSEASTMFMPQYDYETSTVSKWHLFSSNLYLDGEITLTGTARYYFDEQYTIGSGDIHFIPDASYAGMPVPVCFDYPEFGSDPVNGYGYADFDVRGDWDEQSYGGGLCVYSDAPVLRCGNINSTYSDRTELYEIFDGGNANCTKKVEVTLTDIRISYSEQFGPMHTSAKIKEIKEIN